MKKILLSTVAAAILLAGIATVGLAEDPKQPPPDPNVPRTQNPPTGENRNPPSDPNRDQRITDDTQKPPPETPKMPDDDPK